ncbi:MAG: type II toxin-antitoxin system Phd/YefM family antitoxin [Gaiella sp.]|nr:type II toxin-antitoxin system Phd/YefM family antitoxin [Gaiella sp.]
MTWQLQEAKQRFSEVVRRALDDGPQFVTRNGKSAVVVLDVREYRRLKGATMDFKEFLMTAPDFSMLDLERPADLPREIDL